MTEELAQQQVDSDESTSLVLQAQNVKIVDGVSYKAAADLRSHIGTAMDYFENLYRPRIDEAHRHHKSLLSDLKRFHEPLSGAWDRLGELLSDYDTAQEEHRQQEQARLEQEAEDEKRRVADIARDAGQKKLANEILKRPAEPVVAARMLPKIGGLSYREDWKFEIIDAMLLPREYLVPDEIAIGKVVRALRGSANIPGIRVFSQKLAIQKS